VQAEEDSGLINLVRATAGLKTLLGEEQLAKTMLEDLA
jgi:hypothetical protein